ncbi:acyl-CoA carboxylase epsilon subunit [Micromonospora sp. NPDC005203]|uniref:acyl-CoA carboxylase epsilon subunit n=1 Tax=Micromonospora sp. NPDC005203 TaxID=3364226 RepID=UPI00367CB5A9
MTITVRSGDLDLVELAAVVAVLLARAATVASSPDAKRGPYRRSAVWGRPRRYPDVAVAHSWRTLPIVEREVTPAA